MKFYSFITSKIALIVALLAAVLMAWQEQYFRCFLLALFCVMQNDILAIRMHLENENIDPKTLLRRK